jgi:hypothetical protein
MSLSFVATTDDDEEALFVKASVVDERLRPIDSPDFSVVLIKLNEQERRSERVTRATMIC